jgi:hypothetical protein
MDLEEASRMRPGTIFQRIENSCKPRETSQLTDHMTTHTFARISKFRDIGSPSGGITLLISRPLYLIGWHICPCVVSTPQAFKVHTSPPSHGPPLS